MRLEGKRTSKTGVRVLFVWLGSALLVVAVRFAAAGGPGYDVAIQLQASHNLLAGRGLTVYRPSDADLARPARLATLTYFPAGYSLAAAAFLWTGLGVGVIVKVLGAGATILGWWGWSRLALACVRDGTSQRALWGGVAFGIAIATPLFFTPSWTGTDIFLWSVVPWVVELVTRAAEDATSGRRWLDVGAGLLCGFAILMRYASLFLAAYVGFVILWQTRGRTTALIARWTAFSIGVMPALAVQGYINFFVARSRSQPGGLFNAVHNDLLQRFFDAIRLLRTTNYMWAFWLPGQIGSAFYAGNRAMTAWQVAIALAACVCLIAALRDRRGGTPADRDRKVIAAGLFVAIPIVLLGCMMFSTTDYLAEPRYFVPAVPLSALLAYSIATQVRASSIFGSIVGRLWTLYLIAFVAMSATYALFLFVPGRIGVSQRLKLMGDAVPRWPSMAIADDLSPARRFVAERIKHEPNTLLLTSKAGWFYWDPTVDQSRLFELSCEALVADHVNGPATIVILTFDVGRDEDLWYFSRSAAGNHRRAGCFERLPGVHLVGRFPAEGVKVLEAHLATGERVALNR
jgi:hypothetical protein